MNICCNCSASLVSSFTSLHDSTNSAHCSKCGHSTKLSYSDYQCLKMDIHTLAVAAVTKPWGHFYGIQPDANKKVGWRPIGEPVTKRYDCSQCEYATESYRAIDNVPAKAHLCRYCYGLVSEDVQKHYKELVDEPPIAVGSGAKIEPIGLNSIQYNYGSGPFTIKI